MVSLGFYQNSITEWVMLLACYLLFKICVVPVVCSIVKQIANLVIIY